ncbi:MAG: regulatory protein GemA, partial [Omnitrophica bacterium]|nr:regulatory protein GemA [Candidatus Omnitrophota bacterium]
VLGRAFQSYIPFRKIPKAEYGNYEQIWNNYYKAIVGKDAPNWYTAMASYGTAVGIEPPAIRGAIRASEFALTRVATTSETAIIRKAFAPIKGSLERSGVDIKKLYPEGNIIAIDENTELFLNKYISAILRGDKIRVPRWAKIKQLPEVVTKAPKVDKAVTLPLKEILPTTGREILLTSPKVAPAKAEVAKPPIVGGVEPLKAEVTPEIAKATPEQIKQVHTIASKKAFISAKGKVKPQYRHLAKQMTGKTSVKDMTQAEAKIFIDALKDLPEPTFRAGKIVPPSIPRTTALVTEEFFEVVFKKPTPVKLLTSQARYAELLGVKKLAEPFEIGKQKLDIEYGKVAHQIDVATKKLKKADREKMAQLLNIHEEAPPELSEKNTKVFNYFRDLTRDIIARENAVRISLGLEPIKFRKAYFRHTADKMAKEVIDGRYPLPEGIKFWSEQVVGKKVFNPMEMQRKLRDDLLVHFSKDPAYVMKSMVWTGLKEIYLAQPKYFFNRILGALSKDKAVYKNLTPAEKAHYDAQATMPAATKKWLIDYVNIVLGGRQTALDQSVNLWVTDTPIKTVVNAVLKPFGKHIGQKPLTNVIGAISRLPIYGVMGGVRPKQLLRNKMQTLQLLALYGVRPTLLGYLSTSSYPTLEKLKTDSLFKKSYSGFEDMPAELKGKIEKIGLAPYQWSAMSNVSQAMNTAYHWTANKIQNPKFKDHGWADPQRTYTEKRDFFYPSEKARLLKEMEYGAHTTQFQYIGMGMPEVFRYKSLAGITRLQSWWMNHWFIFHREAATRAFTGRTGYDPKLQITLGDRINYLKYLVIAGAILNTLGYERSYLFGTAPTSLPPTAQLALGLYTYATHMGDSDWEKRKRAEAERQIKQAALTFIPGYLSIKDFIALTSGENHWTEYLWYRKSEKGITLR